MGVYCDIGCVSRAGGSSITDTSLIMPTLAQLRWRDLDPVRRWEVAQVLLLHRIGRQLFSQTGILPVCHCFVSEHQYLPASNQTGEQTENMTF